LKKESTDALRLQSADTVLIAVVYEVPFGKIVTDRFSTRKTLNWTNFVKP